MKQIQFVFDYKLHGGFENFLALNPYIPQNQILVVGWINTVIGTDTTRSVVGKALIYYPYKITLPDVPHY